MNNVVEVQFSKFGILQSQFAQERAVQILNVASEKLPSGRQRDH